jgi:hypothetical protein
VQVNSFDLRYNYYAIICKQLLVAKETTAVLRFNMLDLQRYKSYVRKYKRTPECIMRARYRGAQLGSGFV